MDIITSNDKRIIRELAKKVAELAAKPENDELRRLWRALNGLKPERPMVAADQICWNEMDVDGELATRTTDPTCQHYERHMRRIIYRQKYMPDDVPVEPFINVPKAIHGVGLGLGAKQTTIRSDNTSDVHSYHFENQITCMDDLEKVKMPTVSHDTTETSRRVAFARELFDGILDVREIGWDPYVSLWDPIAMWMGVENALYAMMDEPELIHALVARMVKGYMSMLDQLEEQGLFCPPQSLIHCTGAQVDDLPASGYNPDAPRAKDIWMFGLAQMLGTVSPAFYNEFEIEPCMQLFERFGLVYYGCCDPIDGKIPFLRKVKNIRKISVSHWAKQSVLAEEMGNEWVLSRKPNPAYLAYDSFDEGLIRADLTETAEICKRNNCPLEFIQKDISTVRYKPQRLWAWVRIAKEIAMK